MQKLFNKSITIKQLISWMIGFPAGLIVVGEIQDLTYWWVQFAALGLLVAILKWNHVFDQKDYQPKLSRRRSF
jgi:hypothetical protein